jgi:cation transport ATPase
MKIYSFAIEGMSCQQCVQKITSTLLAAYPLAHVDINLDSKELHITSEPILSVAQVQSILNPLKRYQIIEIPAKTKKTDEQPTLPSKRLRTYQPLLILAAYIIIVSAGMTYVGDDPSWMTFMRWFMAGFFLSFSFFKMLDLQAFKQAYQNYDILAARCPIYGYIYPFIELILGVAYLADVMPLYTNTVTLVVMSLGLIGVTRAVFSKKTIRCACLGAVFQLPMSAVTVVENSVMIIMAAVMIWVLV